MIYGGGDKRLGEAVKAKEHVKAKPCVTNSTATIQLSETYCLQSNACSGREVRVI